MGNLAGKSCRKFLRENLVGNLAENLAENLVGIFCGKCCRKILWENLVGKACGKSCRKFLRENHCMCTELLKNLSCSATTWWFTPNNYTIIKTKGLEMYLFWVFLSITFRYFLMVIALCLYRIIEKLSYLALHQIITQLSRLKDVGWKMYRFFSVFPSVVTKPRHG